MLLPFPWVLVRNKTFKRDLCSNLIRFHSPVHYCPVGWGCSMILFVFFHRLNQDEAEMKLSKGDLFIAVKACTKPATFFRWADNKRTLNKCVTDFPGPVGWGYRIHWLHLCKTPTTSVLIYDTKKSDSQVPVLLELWGMRSTPSLPSLPSAFWQE